MPTPQEIIQDHKWRYLDRKLQRNPLLHFYPGSGRLDVCDLFKGLSENVPTTKDHAVFTPERFVANLIGGRFEATIHGVHLPLLNKLRRIDTQAQDALASTGQHSLYLGYPLCVIPEKGKKAKVAPLMLFAVTLSIDVGQQKLTVSRLMEDAKDKVASEASLNQMLAAYMLRKSDISLFEKETPFESEIQEMPAYIRGVVSPWRGLKHDFKQPSVSLFDSLKIKTLDEEKDEPYLVDHALIGLAQFSGQAMLKDLNTLEAIIDPTSCPEALGSFILQRDASPPSLSPRSEPPDDQKCLIEKSDLSQEKVIWAHYCPVKLKKCESRLSIGAG